MTPTRTHTHTHRDDSSYRGFENLFRTLLSLPSQPAVIYLSIYTLEFYELAFGNGVSISPAVFYDVPVVSLRNVGIPQISKNPEDIDRVFYHEADPHPAYRLDKVRAPIFAMYPFISISLP